VSDEPVTWVVAALQVLTALGIAAFWVTWFREPHEEPWLPSGYVEHERVFVFPDSLLATLLVCSAVLAVLELPLGRALGLVCAGMLLFLGVIDAAYYALHGMYARPRGGVLNAAVVAGVLTGAAVFFLAYR
jgi:hypothetical protein